MNDLEKRISEGLRDPQWDLPTWPNPMLRLRRAARLRVVRQTLVALVTIAVLITPLAVARGMLGRHLDSASFTPRPSSSHLAVPMFAGSLGGEVAYKCQNYICLMRPDGTGKRTLTATIPEWDPAWSPDGRVLVFRGYYGSAEGNYDLYSIAADGCQLTRVTHGLNGTSPTWSPTGSQIALVASGIAIVNADGSGLQRLTRDSASYADMSPSWSASGFIAFVRIHGSGPGQIYTMKPDGSDVRQITHGPSGFDHPSWSSTGKQIAYVTDSGVVEVARADGTGTHAVSPKLWTSWAPTWTPGGLVAFVAGDGNDMRGYVVSPDGSHLRELRLSIATPAGSQAQLAWGAANLPPQRCHPTSPVG